LDTNNHRQSSTTSTTATAGWTHQQPSTTIPLDINNIDNPQQLSTVISNPFGQQSTFWTTAPGPRQHQQHQHQQHQQHQQQQDQHPAATRDYVGCFLFGVFWPWSAIAQLLNQKSCDLVVDEKMGFLMNKIRYDSDCL
jgi:hypothetical protein